MSNPAPLCLCETIYRHLCPEHVECSASPYARVRMLAYALLHEMRPAAHTAQVTEEEREALLAGAYAMNGPICAAYDNGDRALETRRKEYQQTLRRLAEQGSGAKESTEGGT